MAEQDVQSAGIYLGRNARAKNINIKGDVVGRDKVVNPAGADDRAQLLAAIEQLRQQVAALEAAQQQAGLRDDAGDELGKAQAAGEQGDHGRLVEKLETARGYLERLGQSIPAALTLAQTVATLVQHAAALG